MHIKVFYKNFLKSFQNINIIKFLLKIIIYNNLGFQLPIHTNNLIILKS